MFSIVCHDPAPQDNFTDEREIALQRIQWLDQYVGFNQWGCDLEWNVSRGSWTSHYRLDCSASIAALFKLTWGGV
jgi:hypothetical protein